MDDIRLRAYPDNVRSCPGMYIGDQDTPTKLLSEIIDNAFDEIIYGASNISIYTRDTYLIIDDGRGIPLSKILDTDIPKRLINMTQLELAISTLHSGTKFEKTKVAAGMNGVGSAVTNALSSEYFVACRTDRYLDTMSPQIKKIVGDKDYYYLYYKKGIRISHGGINQEDLLTKFNININYKISTLVSFVPDSTMFISTKCRIPETLIYKMTMAKSLGYKVNLYINDSLYEDTLSEYSHTVDVTVPSKVKDPKNPNFRVIVSFGINSEIGSKSSTGSINGLYTPRGLHMNYFNRSFTNAWNKIFRPCKGVELRSINYWIIGLCNQPQFNSQTKVDCCSIPDIKLSDSHELSDAIAKIFKDNYEIWSEYYEKVKSMVSLNEDLSRVDYIKSKISIHSDPRSRKLVPINLKDCNNRDRSKCELWIVEGKSAAGTIMQARDPSIHAVLGLRGVPINGSKVDLDRLLDNTEMRDLISAIGMGVDEYHTSTPRYSKIIISADADADGLSITSSICAMIATHMRFLISDGYLYIAKAPLFEQNGKYYYELSDINSIDQSKKYSRFKGLGEMRVSQFKESLLQTTNRKLFRVTLDNCDEAIDLLTRTGARRKLLMDSGVIKS